MSQISRRLVLAVGLAVLACGVTAFARTRPTITFENRSGEQALVRLAGSTSGFVDVADASARTVEVSGGQYRIYVRYGEPGRYHYTKGDPFTVYEGRDGVDVITITLHKVANGNYGTQPSDAAEFGRN
jgi:hypothetical protein